ncbi:glycoside hydrolase family 20 zincin-like fold domain-containing protein, partial [Planctomycetota bacterium]
KVLSVLMCVMGMFFANQTTAGTNQRAKDKITIAYNTKSPQQAFGVSQLSNLLKDKNYKVVEVDLTEAVGDVNIQVVLQKKEIESTIHHEGFRISKSTKGLAIEAVDESGAMYGLLELADLIDIHGLSQVPEKTVNPRFPFRAIKFNLPWSIYGRHESNEQHAETVRDLNYWEGFLDMMAENRFNTLTLWSLHPFPYMIRPTNFPLACSFNDSELEDWQNFWHTLFQMAKDRGIETYLVNWNIFVSEGFKTHYDAKAKADTGHNAGAAYNSPTIEQYTKACVTQVINEYPNLTGLGISLGEAMTGMSPVEREEWITRTFVEGMSEADRKIKFIHRVPFTASANSYGSTDRKTETMTRKAIEALDVIKPVWVEIKFNWSHGHSTPKLVQVHGGSISDAYWNPLPKNYAITWMVRNEDFIFLRWGDPDFIRKHIELNGQSYVGGYYIGSEGYIPAKEYFHVPNHEHINWKYSWERQWLFYKEWGRLLYDPRTPDTVFAIDFDRRYGEGVGEKMVEAYKLASKMPLRFSSFVYSTWDLTMYAEGLLIPRRWQGNGYDDKKSPFISLEELMGYEVLDPDYISVGDYVKSVLDNSLDKSKITPLQLSEELKQIGKQALDIVKDIQNENPSLECEILDIRAWSYQCFYFAEKLEAAVALELYRLNRDELKKQEAVALLKNAKNYWQELINVTKPHYQPVPHKQTGNEYFSWDRFLFEVERDIEVAKNYQTTK